MAGGEYFLDTLLQIQSKKNPAASLSFPTKLVVLPEFVTSCVAAFSCPLLQSTFFFCCVTQPSFLLPFSSLSHSLGVVTVSWHLDRGVHHAATPAVADEASAQGKAADAAAPAAPAAPVAPARAGVSATAAAVAAPSAPPASLPVAAPATASTDLDLFGGQSALRIGDKRAWQRACQCLIMISFT